MADDEMLELVEIETRELLTTYGFDGLATPVVYGSAKLALAGDDGKFGRPSIQALLDALDKHIPDPQRDYDSTFLMPIDNAFLVTGRGTVVVGTIKRGTIKKSQELNLLGFDEKIKTTASEIHVSFFTR